MVKIYLNGEEFVNDNKELLGKRKYMTTFFFYDAPLLKEHNKNNYSFKIEQNGKTILAMKVVPYDLMLFGDVELVGEVADYILVNGYEFDNILCEENLGLQMIKVLSERYNINYEETLAMDYMICNEKTHDYYNEVEVASEKDIDRICEGVKNFIKDCNLTDEFNRDSIVKNISHYRVIRENGVIVSFAILINYNQEETRISDVYTFPSYRGKGYCKKIVNNIKNEIIDLGRIATLNVDQKNPISNHVYSSLGFKRVFSQGEFRKKNDGK